MNRPCWRKSSHSEQGGSCVEVAHTLDRVRDSKDPDGPTLRGDVTALTRAIRTNQFVR